MILNLFLWGMCYSALSHGAVVLGNSHRVITLTEVIDYECLHCRRMQVIINQLLADNPDLKLRIVPVAIINHTSILAATSSLVMAKTSPYFKLYHDYLVSGHSDAGSLKYFLQRYSLNQGKFQHDMHAPWVRDALEQGLALLYRYQSGTPLFLITATHQSTPVYVFKGETDLSVLQHAIEAAKR